MRFGLKFKISVLVALIVLAIMSSIATIFQNRQVRSLRSDMNVRAAKIAQMIGSLSFIQSPGNEGTGWESARQFVNILPQLESSILYIVVADRDGGVQASAVNAALLASLTGRPDVSEVSRALREEVRREIMALPEGGEGDLTKTSPPWLDQLDPVLLKRAVEVELGSEGASLGYVGIGFSLKTIEEKIKRVQIIAVGLTILFLILGIGAAVAVGTSIANPIQEIVKGMDQVRSGDLTAEVKISRGDEIGVLAEAFNFMTGGLRERERVKKTFKRYVSKDVAEKVLAASEEVVLTGERRTVSVLFGDIRGFTSFSEKMEPEDVVGLLNEHFTLMIDVIFRHNGTLDKFMGDAVMAVFGAPVSYGDDAFRAVQAAVDMQKVLVDLNSRRALEGKAPIGMGIGIATGSVVSGNIGSEQRTEFTVIGDTVNTASRIQGETLAGQILICSGTYKDVQGRIPSRVLAPIKVKGKESPVEIHEVKWT